MRIQQMKKKLYFNVINIFLFVVIICSIVIIKELLLLHPIFICLRM